MEEAETQTQARIYRTIKTRICAGAHRPGTVLQAPALARQHGVSMTPVRETLYRLVGEGLVDYQPSSGFSMPIYSRGRLAGMYETQEALLILALREKSEMIVPEPRHWVAGQEDSGPFSAVAARLNNPELACILAGLDDRLRLFRRAERALFADHQKEEEEIAALALAAIDARLRKAIRRYHRRRIRYVLDIIAITSGAIGGSSSDSAPFPESENDDLPKGYSPQKRDL